jgi:hypothetical protein
MNETYVNVDTWDRWKIFTRVTTLLLAVDGAGVIVVFVALSFILDQTLLSLILDVSRLFLIIFVLEMVGVAATVSTTTKTTTTITNVTGEYNIQAASSKVSAS